MTYSLLKYKAAIGRLELGFTSGKLTAVHEGVLEAAGCDVLQGELVEIISSKGKNRVLAEVVGLKNNRILLMPFDRARGLCLNSDVVPLTKTLAVGTGRCLLGRVIDPLGKPLDNKGPISYEEEWDCFGITINPMDREQISKKVTTGVKAIDIFTPLGRGQRIGIMAGSGVGKSTLLGMIASHSDMDVVVIALIGERGREVADFINDVLGETGFKKAIVVVAPAEQPAVIRRQAAFTASTIAESFRKEGKDVLLIMDSITRFALAQRDIGISTGEPMGSRGYPPSVFSLLPPLLERGGNLHGEGSITSIFTVLVEGDDVNEPITDHMRSLLDGHISLSRSLAERNHYPAIDIQGSISRLSQKLYDNDEARAASTLRKLLATYENSRDIIDLGAYEAGNNKELDVAIKYKANLESLLTQGPHQFFSKKETWSLVFELEKLLSKGIEYGR